MKKTVTHTNIEKELKTIEEILSEFEPISLQQMDNVKLQNRIDTKFMFHEKILPSVLSKMKDNYFALEIKNIRFPIHVLITNG